MTRKTVALAALLGCLFVGSAQAGCIYPRAPEHIPDGKSANFDEMAAAHKAVVQFNEDINSYNTCLDMEMASLEQSGQFDQVRLMELRAMQAKKNNAAVDEAQAVADRFNEQLRIFNARNKKD